MKKWDFIIIGFAIACLLGSFYISARVLQGSAGTPTVLIYSDHKLVYEQELTDALTDTVRIDSEWGYNIVHIEQGEVHIEEANCPDLTCTKDWHIRRSGQMIFCLPNRLIVEIKGIQQAEVDDVAQ